MFRLIFIFVILGLGLVAGTQFSDQQGYVLISIANTTTEMSVTTLVIFMVIVLAALFLLENIIKRGLRATNATWHWFSIRKQKRARRYTNEGILKLLEGDWKGAEQKVTRWASPHDMPVLCYLIAAEAAQGMGDENKRKKYLEQAAQYKQNTLSLKITQARQLVRNQDYAQAHTILEHLKARQPNNSIILNLRKRTYIELKLWGALEDLLPKLQKAKLIKNDEYSQLWHQTQLGKVQEISIQKGLDGLINYWRQLPKSRKQDPSLVHLFIQQLLAHKAYTQAFDIIKEQLKRSPTNELYSALTHLELADNRPTINLMESQIKKDRTNGAAYSALGRLYFKDQQWSLAQKSFEEALKIRANANDYVYLADSLEQQNMQQAAGLVSKKALSLFAKHD